jgi:hypothetical protein
VDSSLLDAKMFTMERAVYAELHHKSPVDVGQTWNYSIGFDAGRLVRIKPKKITFTDGWLAAFRVSPHGLPRIIQGRQTRSYIRGFNTGYDAS